MSAPAIPTGCHVAVEASAGTGKTYAIIEYIVHLLRTTETRLDQILLVTFTEKATSELRARLREKVERASSDSLEPTERLRLRRALSGLDRATISTIHGFCSMILEQYAFENGQAFQQALASSEPLLDFCLREVQRREWAATNPAIAAEVLRYCGFNEVSQNGSELEHKILDTSRRINFAAQDRLKPEPSGSQILDTKVFEASLRCALEPLWPLLKGNETLLSYERQTGVQAQARKKRIEMILKPLLQFLAQARASKSLLTLWADLNSRLNLFKQYEALGFNVLIGTSDKKYEVKAEWIRLVEVLENFRVAASATQALLASQSVKWLHERLEKLKKERGQFTFDDLLARVHEALGAPGNPRGEALCRALRDRFQYALVDEFQDTDPLQWKIFERIFLGEGSQRLIVVGDPKQAIYRFRGADFETYLAARTRILSTPNSIKIELATNWRSHPDLLNCLNHIFESGHWFAGTQIQYAQVKSPELGKRPQIISDSTGRQACSFVKLNGASNATLAKRDYFEFIATEIAHLLSAKQPFKFLQRGTEHTLSASHIAVLIENNFDATQVQAVLQAHQVPCSIYKKSGLYVSEEAHHFHFLLKALADPRNPNTFRKLLLTRFFGIRVEALSAYENISTNHPARRLFDTWAEWCAQRDWSPLFHSILKDSGLLLRECTAPNGERRVANFRHLSELLETHARSEGLDIVGLADWLTQKRSSNSRDQLEGDLHRIETELPRVQIMTIHMSKGLEYPVVFVAGGFTERRKESVQTYHESLGDGQFHRIYDLRDPIPQAESALAAREADDEKRRLFYVAMTRAMFKLYVPFYKNEKRKSNAPLQSFIFDSLTAAIKNSPPPSLQIIDPIGTGFKTPAQSSFDQPRDPKAKHLELPAPLGLEILQHASPSFLSRRRTLESFSSLTRRVHAATGPDTGLLEQREADEQAQVQVATPTLLPPGRETGTFLHALLERCDFAEVSAAATPASLLNANCATKALISRLASQNLPSYGTAPTQALELEIASLLWRTLRTPLKIAGLRLCDLPKDKRLHEADFLLSPDKPDALPLFNVKNSSQKYLTGVMDLLFVSNGKFFLLDWKSNWLDDAYAPASLLRSMKEENYELQYRLYSKALLTWLAGRTGKARKPAAYFGGVYYLFLRGMNGIDESSGVFFARPKVAELEGLLTS